MGGRVSPDLSKGRENEEKWRGDGAVNGAKCGGHYTDAVGVNFVSH